MEEFVSSWSHQENIDELKQKLFYTTLELEAVKSKAQEEIKRNSDSMKQMLHLLKITCQERDEAKDQLQKLLTNKANSSVTESNSLSDAYNHSSSPVDSLFDTISSPEFSNINVDSPLVQDYNQNMPKVDQVTFVMEGMIKGKTLPQKGNLLQSVIEAGPLLQNLLVAGSLPRWRNPPPLQTFHVPPMVATIDHINAAEKGDVGSPNKLTKTPMMMLKPSQPYAEMACGSGGVLSFGDVNLGSNFQGRMMAGCSGAGNFGTLLKRQRLH
ncbi:uncharacterized protein [Rutidosis leptorrhynchoides]|uniref:uncharacterized protein n=1 Tax=Rutidosis leptorrhynchoides TaxID=125765 RepID=UPI003A99C271